MEMKSSGQCFQNRFIKRILLLLFVMKYILLFIGKYINPELNRQRIPNSLGYSNEHFKINDLFEAEDLHREATSLVER